MRASQENVAPNILELSAGEESRRAPPKRTRKKVARSRPTDVVVPADAAVGETAAAEPVGSAGKQQKLSDGSAALLQRCSGVTEANSASSEISPPLEKVVARHAAFANHAKVSALRRSSSLGMNVLQADGSGARELDWLSHTVATCELGRGRC